MTEGSERYWEARWRDEKAENERLRAAVKFYEDNDAALVNTLRAQRDELLAALEMIAGKRQCLDNLMSDKDIASAAIAKAEGKL
jgi:hypothetical protein